MKYIAVRLRGSQVWFWFDLNKVEERNGRFIGKEGWGKGGALTSVDVPLSDISGKMFSNSLQY